MVLNIRDEEDLSRRDRIEDTTSHPGGSPTPPETTHPRTSSTASYPHHHNSNGKYRRRSSLQHEENGQLIGPSSDAPLDFSVKRKEGSDVVGVECNGKNGRETINSSSDLEVGSSSSPQQRYRNSNDKPPSLLPLIDAVPVASKVVVKIEKEDASPELKNGHHNHSSDDQLADHKPAAFPRFLPPGGFGLGPQSMLGLPPYFATGMGAMPPLVADQLLNAGSNSDQPTPPNGSSSSIKTSHKNRAFKSYPKDPLSLPMGYFGLPNNMAAIAAATTAAATLPAAIDVTTAQAMSQNSEEMYKYYREYVLQLQLQQQQQQLLQQQHRTSNNHKNSHHPHTMHVEDISDTESLKDQNQQHQQLQLCNDNSSKSSSSSGSGHAPQSPPCLPSQSSQSPPYNNHHINKPSNTNNGSGSISYPTTPTSGGGGGCMGGLGNDSQLSAARKRSRLPDEQKDESYWERRRKNNEAAKRSRDSRRAKEDEIAIRAAYLEQENLKLRVEVAALKTETAKLRCMLYNS